MDKNIQQFIKNEKNLTFCTTVNNIPHCSNCFYAFDVESNSLFFKSGKNTQHIKNALLNNNVAGTIVPDLQKIGTIKGIQYFGKFIIPTSEILQTAKNIYYTKYPFAIAISGELWSIALISIKMTDNTLGFGKKYFWESAAETTLVENR